jgi:hypothetical protein
METNVFNNAPKKSREEREANLNKLLPLFKESSRLMEENDPHWKFWKKFQKEKKIK